MLRLADGADNYDSLVEIGWQVHVYGTASVALVLWCKEQAVPLHVFEWRHEHGVAGLMRNAAYLLRPDTYVAAAESAGNADAFERYISRRHFRLGTAAEVPPVTK